ncbi:MAG TPA: FAD-binding oxidoreductase, partial [Microthrixaceae bacterium]|nr:FAD-binding oxidoreductase [Microthrixaceae bacterium]
TWDVVIVGGGFTGLWTARSLLDLDADLRVLVVEAEHCGFGASGRNGGWCSALFPTSFSKLAAEHGGAAASAMREAMRNAVDEVGAAAVVDGIDCDFAKGGTLTLATNPAHLDRVRAHAEPDDEWLDASTARSRLDTPGLLGASFTPHCAAIHPGKLVEGLAAATERRGAVIVERSPVASIAPGVTTLRDGTRIRADAVVRATEGYTASLRGHRRDLVPLYSLMIATEPLSDDVWASIGLSNRETFTDGRRMIIYGQRTADGRIAFGGRGAPYHFGSRTSPGFDSDDRVFDRLESTLRAMFPQIGVAAITHRWGGALGVPRDWSASVGFDPVTRVGWAGGYVGDGVSTTNLAGRTLADLVLGRETPITELPWVGHRSRRWEPEPFRWLGVNAGRGLAEVADAIEARTKRPLG